MKKHIVDLAFFLGFALFLSACNYLFSNPATENKNADEVVTITSTLTQTATSTNSPTFTPTATITPSKAPTFTPSATPTQKPNLENVEIINVGYLESGYLMITIESSNKIEDKYQVLVGEDIYEYKIIEDYPNRLYFYGIPSKPDSQVELIIRIKDTDIEVFRSDIYIPASPRSQGGGNGAGSGEDDGGGEEGPPDVGH